jgi:hypothetical protein
MYVGLDFKYLRLTTCFQGSGVCLPDIPIQYRLGQRIATSRTCIEAPLHL